MEGEKEGRAGVGWGDAGRCRHWQQLSPVKESRGALRSEAAPCPAFMSRATLLARRLQGGG